MSRPFVLLKTQKTLGTILENSSWLISKENGNITGQQRMLYRYPNMVNLGHSPEQSFLLPNKSGQCDFHELTVTGMVL